MRSHALRAQFDKTPPEEFASVEENDRSQFFFIGKGTPKFPTRWVFIVIENSAETPGSHVTRGPDKEGRLYCAMNSGTKAAHILIPSRLIEKDAQKELKRLRDKDRPRRPRPQAPPETEAISGSLSSLDLGTRTNYRALTRNWSDKMDCHNLALGLTRIAARIPQVQCAYREYLALIAAKAKQEAGRYIWEDRSLLRTALLNTRLSEAHVRAAVDACLGGMDAYRPHCESYIHYLISYLRRNLMSSEAGRLLIINAASAAAKQVYEATKRN